jgi:hypothetical protein
MAVSLAFGLILATVLVLYLVPVFYSIYVAVTGGRRNKLDLDDADDDHDEPHSPQVAEAKADEVDSTLEPEVVLH